MRKARKKFIIGVATGAVILIAATIVTVLTNQTLTGPEKTTQALTWSIVIALLGVIIYAIIEVYYQVTKPKPHVEVIEDQNTLKERYEEMRRTEGATCVQAIWSARYKDVEAYFKTEGNDLKLNQSLEVERLVNPNAIAHKYHKQFAEFIRNNPNLKVWATDVKEFECYICEYVKGDVTRLKALLVLNDTLSRAPQLGIFIDPERSADLKPVVYALQSWFLGLPRKRFPGTGTETETETAENIWEVNAPAYDAYVTSTDYRFLRKFMDKEQKFLEREVSAIVDSGKSVVIIEVGSGTGRTLFNLAKKRELLSKMEYLIGIDNSQSMIRMARSKREASPLSLSSDEAGKLLFFHFDGTRLPQYFLRGRVEVERLRRDVGNGEPLEKLDAKVFEKTTKIICCLLNTVGVMDQGIRVEVIRSMVSAASPSDLLIFSVLSSASFNKYAPELYKTIQPLVGDFEGNAFHQDSCEFKTDKYYSKWFDKQGFCATLEEEGCSNINVKPVDDSGYFITCSPSS